MHNGHIYTHFQSTNHPQSGKQLPVVWLILCSLLLLAGCQPISPDLKSTTSNSGVATVAAATALPATIEPTATEALALPTPTPTTIVTLTTIITPTNALTTTTEATTVAATSTVETVALPLPTATAEQVTTPQEAATEALPTPESVLPAPTDTPVSSPFVRASKTINVRNGPGTDYVAINALAADAQADVIGTNGDASWWQISMLDGTSGWVYAPLVEFVGDPATIAVVDVPPPPPTDTPIPQPTVQAEATQVPVAAVVEVAATAVPATEAPTPQPQPANTGTTFRVIEKRLWDVYENGGTLDGSSVKCGEKRQLVVVVVDANGVRLNGVAVQVQYGAKEIFVTGSQGKGDGNAEFVLGSGQDVMVIRDADGSEVSSDVATGLVTRPDAIPFENLIASRYCTDQNSCTSFVATAGCLGHYSWTVTFQRSY